MLSRRSLLLSTPLILSTACSDSGKGNRVAANPAAFNGRWNIVPDNDPKRRAWWLEIEGAEKPETLRGKFVGATGGGMYEIPEIAIEGDALRFAFEKKQRLDEGKEPVMAKSVWIARAEEGMLHGNYEIEGSGKPPMHWTGKRAPEIGETDDGSWKEQAPVELFNGRNLDGWKAVVPGQPLGWKAGKGLLKNEPHANNLESEQEFWNFILRAEYRLFEGSNSGIGLRGRYEIQLLDDFGKPPDKHSHGALYSRVAPAVNASKKLGEWQQMEIRLVGRDLSATLNGQKIHDHTQIEGLTAMATDAREGEPGPITIQGDHERVEFRKITVIPLRK